MSKIISVHSFRGGTGKSNTTANLAALLANSGLRVGIVDTDIQAPGIHVIFGMDRMKIVHSLNDYLWGECAIDQTAYDVTDNLGAPVSGKIYVIPSSLNVGEITRILREGYDVARLNDGFEDLINSLELDYLLIDTHPGVNEETLLSIAISDALILIMRPDQQDYLGTAVTVAVARKLEVPQLMLVVNKVPQDFPVEEVRKRVEDAYGVPVTALLPHSDDMMKLASEGVFVLRYPDHPMTGLYGQIVAQVTAGKERR